VQVKEAEMHKTKHNNGHIICRKWNFQTQVETRDILLCLYTHENAKCWKITNILNQAIPEVATAGRHMTVRKMKDFMI